MFLIVGIIILKINKKNGIFKPTKFSFFIFLILFFPFILSFFPDYFPGGLFSEPIIIEIFVEALGVVLLSYAMFISDLLVLAKSQGFDLIARKIDGYWSYYYPNETTTIVLLLLGAFLFYIFSLILDNLLKLTIKTIYQQLVRFKNLFSNKINY